MSFVVLSWECRTPVGPADIAVREAIVAAGTDGPPPSVNVALRTVLIDEDRLGTDDLLDGLDAAVQDTSLLRYFLLLAQDAAYCGGYLVQGYDSAVGEEITGSNQFPFSTRP